MDQGLTKVSLPEFIFPFPQVMKKIMNATGIQNKVAAFALLLVFIAAGTISFLILAIFLSGGFLF